MSKTSMRLEAKAGYGWEKGNPDILRRRLSTLVRDFRNLASFKVPSEQDSDRCPGDVIIAYLRTTMYFYDSHNCVLPY